MMRVHPSRCDHTKRLMPAHYTPEQIEAMQIGCDVCCPRVVVDLKEEWAKSAFVRSIGEKMDIQIMEQLFTVGS